jgi:hypothetical protein
MRVTDVQAPDAAGEVQKRVPVDVGDRRAARLRGDDREQSAERGPAIAACLRARIASDFGPGTLVRSSIERVAATSAR